MNLFEFWGTLKQRETEAGNTYFVQKGRRLLSNAHLLCRTSTLAELLDFDTAVRDYFQREQGYELLVGVPPLHEEGPRTILLDGGSHSALIRCFPEEKIHLVSLQGLPNGFERRIDELHVLTRQFNGTYRAPREEEYAQAM